MQPIGALVFEASLGVPKLNGLSLFEDLCPYGHTQKQKHSRRATVEVLQKGLIWD